MPPVADPSTVDSDAATTDMAALATQQREPGPSFSDAATANFDNGDGIRLRSNPVQEEPVNAMTPTPAPQSDDTSDTGDAGGAHATALADDLRYTLTVGQALEQFSRARRKIPSARSMQRYCIDGQIAAQKIRTTYGSEWLINEDALRRFIAAQSEIAAVASDATTTDMAALATTRPQNTFGLAPVTTDARAAGVASEPASETMSAPEGERRSIAEVLIENARLLARVEGKDEIIAELKEDKNFLREEVREARKTRDDVKNIAERMLDTLKTMAIGRLTSGSLRDEPVRTSFVEHSDQRSG